ncbi:hypothetical protein BC940DRAFT_317861 [Gongronella butleri]|nr:hypothetical protein BC940DRAFT_317861 [Gongronella butleri]
MLNLNETQKQVVTLIYDTVVAALSKSEIKALMKTYQNIHATTLLTPDNTVTTTTDEGNDDSAASPSGSLKEESVATAIDARARQQIDKFAAWSFSTSGLTMDDDVLPLLHAAIPESSHATIARVLKLMSSSMGMCILSMGKRTTSFLTMTPKQRQQVILAWRKSTTMHMLYRVFTTTATFLCYGQMCDHPTDAASLMHTIGVQQDASTAAHHHAPSPITKMPLPPPPPRAQPLRTVSLEQVDDWVSKNHKFDAIIVGSGVAAGPCVWELARAGKSVLVIEKGSYNHAPVVGDRNTYEQLYYGGSYFSSRRGFITMSCASTLGGGSTISFGACVKTPPSVLQEWHQRTSKAFDVHAFEKDMDMLYEKMGATTDFSHTDANLRLIYGCTKQQKTVKQLPHVQPQYDAQHGYSGINMTMWFEEAQQYGAEFLCDTTVEEVFIRHDHAQGVVCTLTNGMQVTLQSRVVIMASGALHTPDLLRKSGLSNKHIGKHLKVHPTIHVSGYFPNPLDGPAPKPARASDTTDKTAKNEILPLTTSYHLLSDDEYGCRIESYPLGIGQLSSLMTWNGALHHKQTMLGYRHGCTLSIRCRDMNSHASVQTSPEPGVPPSYEFQLSPRDHDMLLSGIIEGLNILTAAGARHLHCPQVTVEPFVFKKYEDSNVLNPRYQAWLQRVLEAGITPADGIYSMHQSSTCRMGYSVKQSAVQLTGETWEIKNLFLIDSSVLPTCVGVNPMLTIQTMSYGVTQKILQRLNFKFRP